MAATFPPYMRTPFVDLTSGMFTHQSRPGLCADMEMNLMKCREAYGLFRAQEKCRDYLEDLHECMHHGKQTQRYREMKKETDRQIKEGILPKDTRENLNPAPDSFQNS